MNYARSNSLKLKYYRFKPSGCKDIGIREMWVCGKNSIPFANDINETEPTNEVSVTEWNYNEILRLFN